MEDRETTVRSRALGAGLRDALEAAGLTGRDAAKQLGWSPATVSRLLTGKRGGGAVDVSALLAVSGVVGAERRRLLKLTEDLEKTDWLQHWGSETSENLRTVISHERAASAIASYHSQLLSGLVQTRQYIRAVLAGYTTFPRSKLRRGWLHVWPDSAS